MTRHPFRRFLSRVLTGIPDTVPPTDPTNLPWTGDVASLAWDDLSDDDARALDDIRAGLAAYDLGLAASPPLSQTPCFRDALVAIGGAR